MPPYQNPILTLIPIPTAATISEQRRTSQPKAPIKTTSHFSDLIPLPSPTEFNRSDMTRRKIKHVSSPSSDTPHQQKQVADSWNPQHRTPQTYAQTLAQPQIHNKSPTLFQQTPPPQPPPPHRFPIPPWQYYLEQNPWTFASSPTDNILHNPYTPNPLPLPPDPNHPAWRGRCYNCLALGHDQNDCTSTDRVCAKCWSKGA